MPRSSQSHRDERVFGILGRDGCSTTTDASGTTNYTYDTMDRLTQKQAPEGTLNYSYDAAGNLATMQSADGAVNVTYNWDSLNRLQEAIDGRLGTTSYAYDNASNVGSVTYPSGVKAQFTYDAGSRLTGVTDSISGTISRTYDGLNHVLSETTPQGSVGYTYDLDERRQTMTVSGQSQINYAFDNDSRLTSITQGGAGVSFGYDNDSRRTSMALPNGNTAVYNYDAASQLLGIVYQGGALGVANLEYSYDLAGRRVAVSGSLASQQLPAAVSSATYNANNQLTQWGSTSMTYDLDGNTLNDGTNSYVWDARNRLASANSNGATFSYDPLGRRVSKTLLSTTTNFLYDGVNSVQEQSGGAVTANLLTGGVDERFQRTDSTGSYSYLTDALGSTVALTNSTDASVEQYSYSPYGLLSATGSNQNPYTYTGREADGLGIDYYRARYYNPNTGRFLSEDPIGFRGGINKYAYTYDTPTNFRDPSGKFVIGAAIGGAVGGVTGVMGAYLQGGSVGDMAVAGLLGAGAGFALGTIDPTEGVLTVGQIALIGGGAGFFGDVIGQGIGNIGKKCHSFNVGEAIGSGIGGAAAGYMGAVMAIGAESVGAGEIGQSLMGGGISMGPSVAGGVIGNGLGPTVGRQCGCQE